MLWKKNVSSLVPGAERFDCCFRTCTREESLGTVAKPCDWVHFLMSALSSDFARDSEFLSLQVNEI